MASTETPATKLRLINLGWTIVLGTATWLSIRGIQIRSAEGKWFPDADLIKKLVLLFFILVFLLNTVRGTIRPSDTDFGTLRLVGKVTRYCWIIAILFVAAYAFTSWIDTNWTAVIASSTGMLILALFGQYTVTNVHPPQPLDPDR